MSKVMSSSSRFVKPTINWSELGGLVNPEEKVKFLAFKAKSESYYRRVASNPESPPPINWAEYKKLVPSEDLVNKLQAEYERFKVPYPKDHLSKEVDKQWEELSPKIKDYCNKQQQIINEAQTELGKINALPPFERMTMEMFHDLYPEQAISPVARPTFWPHTPEEQLGYVDPLAEKH